MQQNLILAVAFALLNAVMLSAMSLCAKLLGSYFAPIEITFFRNASSFIFLIAFLFFAGSLRSIHKTAHPVAHLIRSSIGTLGIVIGMWSFILSPRAVATTLFFTAPLFVVMLSPFILSEKIGPLRIGGVVVGFCGVGVIAYPAFTEMGGQDLTILGVTIGILYGFVAGCVDICLRWLGKTESSSTTTFYFLIFGILATALYWPFSPKAPWDLNLDALTIIFFLGLTGGYLAARQKPELSTWSSLIDCTRHLYDDFMGGAV